jgi:hypothetical protein
VGAGKGREPRGGGAGRGHGHGWDGFESATHRAKGSAGMLEHVCPIERDNVILYGQYILDRKLIR